jgi:hypothetical protein
LEVIGLNNGAPPLYSAVKIFTYLSNPTGIIGSFH